MKQNYTLKMINEVWTKWQLRPKNVITQIFQSLYYFISTLVQLDEFQQICTVYASNRNLTIENFPLGRLSKFLLTLTYLIHITKPCKTIIHQYSWNFVLKRQKLPDILCVYPVTLSIESQVKMEKFYHKQKQLRYKIETIEDDDAVEFNESNSEWSLGTWEIK